MLIRAVERDNPELISPDSPTQIVGGSASFNPVKHSEPMLSLDNAFSEAEIVEWINGLIKDLPTVMVSKHLEFAIEPKYDGLAVNLVYEYGRLTQAATRGDGVTGRISQLTRVWLSAFLALSRDWLIFLASKFVVK